MIFRRKYFKKEKQKNVKLGKTRASVERYYLATKKKSGTKKKRSYQQCYKQCFRILQKTDAVERDALKAFYSANIKDREMWGIIIAVASTLFGYLVASYGNLFEIELSEIENEVINQIDFTSLLGSILFFGMFFMTCVILRFVAMDTFMLNVLEDINKEGE